MRLRNRQSSASISFVALPIRTNCLLRRRKISSFSSISNWDVRVGFNVLKRIKGSKTMRRITKTARENLAAAIRLVSLSTAVEVLEEKRKGYFHPRFTPWRGSSEMENSDTGTIRAKHRKQSKNRENDAAWRLFRLVIRKRKKSVKASTNGLEFYIWNGRASPWAHGALTGGAYRSSYDTIGGINIEFEWRYRCSEIIIEGREKEREQKGAADEANPRRTLQKWESEAQ